MKTLITYLAINMWCDISNTDYKKNLVAKLGDKRARQFAMSVDSQKFKDWFGNGKSITLSNRVKVPYVNPIMQVFNENNQPVNLLEAYKLSSMEDTKRFLSTYPSIEQDGDLFSITESPDKYINIQLFSELNRIYPDLFTTLTPTDFRLNPAYIFPNTNSTNELIAEARTLIPNINGIYRTVIEDDLLQGIFEAAVQANSSESEKRTTIKVFGERFVQIAQALYPNARVGDTLENYDSPTKLYSKVVKDTIVDYSLKAASILQSDRAKQIFDKGSKAKWSLDKILQELNIPKDQQIILKSLNVSSREDLIVSLAASYSFTVEVNTAKEIKRKVRKNVELTHDEYEALSYLDADQAFELNDNRFEVIGENTSHYFNMTVPGGTNYSENEIKTPQIIPSIKGHAGFSTDQGIGWFRSDEQGESIPNGPKISDGAGGLVQATINKGSKTRRILEVQSDLFQKGRDSKELTSVKQKQSLYGDTYRDIDGFRYLLQTDPEDGGYFKADLSKDLTSPHIWIRIKSDEFDEAMRKEAPLNSPEVLQNNFLQLLNKDNNWVNFFLKSIVQDSAKKGYEKVLFPTGETAAKVEGHETIADEIKSVNHQIESLKNTDFEAEYQAILIRAKEMLSFEEANSTSSNKQDELSSYTDIYINPELVNSTYNYARIRPNYWNRKFLPNDTQTLTGDDYDGFVLYEYTVGTTPTVTKISNERALELINLNIELHVQNSNNNLISAKEHIKKIENTKDKMIKELKENNLVTLKAAEKNKEELKSQGIEKLKPIEAFYEIKVGNILNKTYKDKVKRVTDEHGNDWWEVDINKIPEADISTILLQKASQGIENEVVKVEHVVENLTNMLDMLSMRFGIPYQLINDASNRNSGLFDYNKVTINLAHVKADTALHEFAHPFILTLEKENPKLYRELLLEFQHTKEGQDIYNQVNKFYPELNYKDKQHEMIVTYLGKQAALKIDQQSSLITRFIKWLKSLFKQLNAVDFKNLSLNTTLDELANMLVDPTVTADLKANLRKSDALVRYQKTSPDTDITYDSIFDKIKDRVKILNATIKKRKQGEEFKEDIAELTAIIDSKDVIASINGFVANSMNYVQTAYNRMETLRESVKDTSKLTPQQIGTNLYVLGEIQQLLNVFDSLHDVNLLFISEGKKVGTDDEMNKIANALGLQDKMVKDFKKFALTYVTEWLYPYVEGSNKEAIRLDKKDLTLSKEQFKEQLSVATRDIDMASYLLGASINSRDPISAAVGLALKDIIYTNHVKDVKIAKDLTEAYSQVRKTALYASVKDEEAFNAQFLREVDNYEEIDRDENDKPVYGYKRRLAFHTEYNDSEYEKNKAEFFKNLGDKPNKTTHPNEYKEWQKKVSEFYANNTQINPDSEKIIDTKRATLTPRQFDRWILSNTTEVENETYDSGKQKSDYFAETKKMYSIDHKRGTFRIYSGELTKLAEKYRNREFGKLMSNAYFTELYGAYKNANDKLGDYGLRHGIIPQIGKSKGITGDVSTGKSTKENLKAIKDGLVRSVTADYDSPYAVQRQDGTEVKHVPINFTKMIPTENLKTDMLSSVLRFSQMANNYEALTEVEPNIIVLKTILNGDLNLGIRGRQIAKTNASGIALINKITDKVVTKLSGEERLNRRLNEFIDDVVFGESEFAETHNIKGVDVSINKLARKFGLVTSVTNMALNFTGGINNVIVGNYNNMLEGMGGRFYGKKDWLWAQKEYWVQMPAVIGSLTGQIESPLTALSDHYDVPQGEFMNEYGHNVSGGLLNKRARTSSLFFIQQGGEHQIQLTGLLSLMHATKVMDKSGNEVSLFEAWKKGNPVNNADFKWTKEDDAAFRNRLHAITKNLQGVYNKFDKATLQRRWYGKLALMFRKYMFTAFKSRYGKRYMDHELGTVNEGYWRAFVNKLRDDVKEFKFGVITRMWSKEGYNELEINAINRTVFEIGVILAAFLLAGFSDGDDDKSWLEAEADLQITRMSADITQFINPKDLIRVLRNPAATVSLLEKWLSVFAQLTSPTEKYERRAGIAKKGDNKLFIKLLKTMPILRHFINILTPDEQRKFYQLSNR